jgi:hypothetical protein
MIAFPVTATIKATASRDERSVSYTATADKKLPHDGVLKVTEWAGVRVKRTIVTTYHVREVPMGALPGRRFESAFMSCKGLEGTSRGKATALRIGGVYTTTIKPDGDGRCNCAAAEIGNHECVHILAIRELIATGGMEDPLAYLPPTPQEDIGDELLADRPLPPEPCFATPNGERRAEVVAWRLANGYQPTHPDDLDW